MGATRSYEPEKVMNGTFGYVYFEGDEVIEIESFKAETSVSYGDIKQPGDLYIGKKMLELAGTGEFTINVIDHRVLRKVAERVNQGKTPKFYITAIMDDPDSDEVPAYGFKNCTIENLPWMDIQPANVTKQSYTFAFTQAVNINKSEV